MYKDHLFNGDNSLKKLTIDPNPSNRS